MAPALIKPTTIAFEASLDWIAIVATAPIHMFAIGLFSVLLKKFLTLMEMVFFIPFDIILIPTNKTVIPTSR